MLERVSPRAAIDAIAGARAHILSAPQLFICPCVSAQDLPQGSTKLEKASRAAYGPFERSTEVYAERTRDRGKSALGRCVEGPKHAIPRRTDVHFFAIFGGGSGHYGLCALASNRARQRRQQKKGWVCTSSSSYHHQTLPRDSLIMPTLRLGSIAPNFTAETTQ